MTLVCRAVDLDLSEMYCQRNPLLVKRSLPPGSVISRVPAVGGVRCPHNGRCAVGIIREYITIQVTTSTISFVPHMHNILQRIGSHLMGGTHLARMAEQDQDGTPAAGVDVEGSVPGGVFHRCRLVGMP